MKRTLTAFGVAAAVAALSFGVQAQSTTGSQSGSAAGAYSQSDKEGKTLRLTGCLQADPDGKGYILTNVTESSSMSSAGETSSGTSGTGTSGSTSSASGDQAHRVELVASSSVDLKNHVGERIEVTGSAQGRSKILSDTSSSASGTSSSSSGQSGTSGSMSGSSSSMGEGHWAGQKIKVQSVRQVASSCSGQ